MKNLKILLLFIILSTNSILLSAQSSKEDNTRDYHLQIWKAWELVQIAKEGSSCDSLVKKQAKDINMGLKYEASQDSLLRLRSIQIGTLTSDAKNWEDRFNNQVALTKIQKKKKRKWVFISIGIAALSIYTNLPD